MLLDQHGTGGRAVFLHARRGQRTDRTAVKRTLERDDVWTAGGLTSDFERHLVGLRARTAVENSRVRVWGVAEQELARGYPDRRVNGAGVKQELSCLTDDRVDDGGVTVARESDCVPSVKIEVTLAMGVEQVTALATHRDHRHARVDPQLAPFGPLSQQLDIGERGHSLVGSSLRVGHGTSAVSRSPRSSCSPNARFMHCTAWPAAPRTRLSIAAIASTTPPSS